MTKLSWGSPGSQQFEAGVDRGILYPSSAPAAAWSGLVSVTEEAGDSEKALLYWDGVPYANKLAGTGFDATLEAYTYPEAFEKYDGVSGFVSAQYRESFGLSYRTLIGSDIDGVDHGYKIHLVYNAIAQPSSKTFDSLDMSAEAATFSWKITTRPSSLATGEFAAHLVIDTRYAYAWTVKALEDILYGTDTSAPRLPTPDEVVGIFDDNSILKITDHGDGTWTAEGPDDVVWLTNPTTFVISWPSAVYIDTVSYTVHSL